MSNDIVEQLRLLQSGAAWQCEETSITLEDAADEIERLRVECERLAAEVSRAHRDALAWMERAAVGAAVLDYLLLPEWLNKPGGDSDVWAIRKSDLRALRAALAAKEPGHE